VYAAARVRTSLVGHVRAATTGQVLVQIYARRGHRWALVAQLPTKVGANGTFARVVALMAHRRYRVRALYTGAPGFRASRSAFIRVVPHTASRHRKHGR
jgi:hypothetical protein